MVELCLDGWRWCVYLRDRSHTRRPVRSRKFDGRSECFAIMEIVKSELDVFGIGVKTFLKSIFKLRRFIIKEQCAEGLSKERLRSNCSSLVSYLSVKPFYILPLMYEQCCKVFIQLKLQTVHDMAFSRILVKVNEDCITLPFLR
jgi:hypothetical protein